LKLIEVAGQMFVEKKDRLKLLVFSHWLNPRAKVMFNGAHDPAGLGLGHGCLYPCIIPQDVTGLERQRTGSKALLEKVCQLTTHAAFALAQCACLSMASMISGHIGMGSAWPMP
jgi:hypothetical protein